MDTSITKRLVAILFADIQGYTALMQRDEDGAAQILRHFQQQMEEKVNAYKGQIANFYGDGALCTFPIPLDAVRCAMDLQKAFGLEPVTPVRIGIHMGTVVFENEKVYGDSVNIASRIESIAVPGGILFSKKIWDEIKNQPDLKMTSLGSFNFKNIEEKLEVFALGTEGLVVPDRKKLQGKLADNNSGNKTGLYIAALIGLLGLSVFWVVFFKKSHTPPLQEKSIAILPFKNVGNDTTQVYLGDGIAEEILVSLAQIKSLKVIGRSSAFAFKNSPENIKSIGEKLNVKTILEGSVRQLGTHLRVTAQLTSVEDGFLIWTSKYERDFKDIFDIQDEIAREVVKGLKLQLSLEEKRRLAKRYTENTEVYNLYLQAMEQFDRNTIQGIQNGEKLFHQILKLDPNYAPVLASMAFDTIVKGGSLKDAYQIIDQTLAIDPESGDAYHYKGLLLFYKELKFAEAELALRKAIELGTSSAYVILTELLVKAGRFQETIKMSNQLRAVEPLYENNFTPWEPLAVYLAGDTARGIKMMEEGLRFFPNRDFFGKMGKLYLHAGQVNKAIKTLEKGVTADGVSPHLAAILADLSIAYNKTHQQPKSDSLLMGFNRQYLKKEGWCPAYYQAQIYSGRGQGELALKWLEKAVEARETELIWLKIDPAFNILHKNPQYLKLLNKVGFPRVLKN